MNCQRQTDSQSIPWTPCYITLHTHPTPQQRPVLNQGSFIGNWPQLKPQPIQISYSSFWLKWLNLL